jgi:hypothetical protein
MSVGKNTRESLESGKSGEKQKGDELSGGGSVTGHVKKEENGKIDSFIFFFFMIIGYYYC